MTGFRTRKIASAASVGEQLSAKRNELGLTLDQAAKETKISSKYLAALEAGKLQDLPGEIYSRNFIRHYAAWLGLDANQLASQHCSERKLHNQTNNAAQQRNFDRPVERVSPLSLVVSPKLIRNAAIGFLALLVIVYLGTRIQNIFQSPELVVTTPAEDLVTVQNVITIEGHTDKTAVVAINGQQVLTNEDGNFSEVLTLSNGTNVIEVTARKKRSQVAKIYRRVVIIQEGS